MNNSKYGIQMTNEIVTNNLSSSVNRYVPRLKKNKRLALRWGQQYYTALQDAVFSVRNNCYTSYDDMSVSLRGENQASKKHYHCKYCGDSFHYQNSFHDHNARYSWILGYWCTHCFYARSDYTSNEKIICRNIKSKRAYLKRNGLCKEQKIGEILLFYNQCQFFKHLKKHNITIVDMGDIMLMPLPDNIQYSEYAHLDRVCKILMEYMFIKRIHIMDWLRHNKVDSKWWIINENSHDNPIGDMLKKYNSDCIFNGTIGFLRKKFNNRNLMNVDIKLATSSGDYDNHCVIDMPIVDYDTVSSNSIILKKKIDGKSTDISSTINESLVTLTSTSEHNDFPGDRNLYISTFPNQLSLDSIQNKSIIIISQEPKIIQKLSMNSHFLGDKKIPIAINKNVSYVKTSGYKIVPSSRAKSIVRQINNPSTSLLRMNFDQILISLMQSNFHNLKNNLNIGPEKIVIFKMNQIKNFSQKFIENPCKHTEIRKIIYYTCPFCSFFIIDIEKNRQMIQDHVLGKHASRLCEVITLNTAKFFIDRCIYSILQPSCYISAVSATSIADPVIVGGCSISSETFDIISKSKNISTIAVQDNLNILQLSKFDDNSSNIHCPQNEIINTNIKLKKNKENKEIVEFFSIATGLNSITNIKSDMVKETNIGNIHTNTLEMSEMKDSLRTQLKTQIATTTVYYITDKSNISVPNVTSEIYTAKTVIENTKISNNERKKQNSQLHGNYILTTQSKKKVTKKIMSNIQLSIKRKRRRQRPWRIALNGPNNSNIAPINYKCHLCNELISTSWPIANKHFNANHSRDYRVTTVVPVVTRLSINDMEIKSKNNIRKRKLDSNFTTVKKRRRWFHKKFSDRSTSPTFGIFIRQEPIQDTDGNFKCKKCECSFKDVNTFREHVASNHRISGRFLICLECGENFVVAPSLQMHLKAFHGITNPITYMAQNTQYAPDIINEFEMQEKITDSNQCYVCKTFFEDKTAVDKHMRVHGMAFLNRKRIEARNALRNHEKKKGITTLPSNTHDIGVEIEKKNLNTNNQDVLPESDSANINILTRISRLLS